MYLSSLASYTSFTFWITFCFFWQDFDQTGWFLLQFTYFSVRVSEEVW